MMFHFKVSKTVVEMLHGWDFSEKEEFISQKELDHSLSVLMLKKS